MSTNCRTNRKSGRERDKEKKGDSMFNACVATFFHRIEWKYFSIPRKKNHVRSLIVAIQSKEFYLENYNNRSISINEQNFPFLFWLNNQFRLFSFLFVSCQSLLELISQILFSSMNFLSNLSRTKSAPNHVHIYLFLIIIIMAGIWQRQLIYFCGWSDDSVWRVRR